jgi:hypothetical protein
MYSYTSHWIIYKGMPKHPFDPHLLVCAQARIHARKGYCLQQNLSLNITER